MRPPTLKQHVYHAIRQKMQTGALPPGCRLSDETLAKEIGVSRSPVREAISQLSSEGLVEYRPRCGAFVKWPSQRELADLYEIRLALEGYAASKAAILATSSQIAGLERTYQELLTVLDENPQAPDAPLSQPLLQALVDNDLQFHLQILQMAGNERLFKMVEDCKILIRVFVPTMFDYEFRVVDTVREHAAVLAAIKRRESESARDLMAAHIAAAQNWIVPRIKEAGLVQAEGPAGHSSPVRP